MSTLVVVAGPTASGKTAFSIALAKALNTVVISADSRQFYNEMSIGTAVPSLKELNEVKHYKIHNISIEDDYNVSMYEKEVLELLETLFVERDKVILTGGSGLFIDAVCHGIDPMPEVSPLTRERVERLYEEGGLMALKSELLRCDPEYYAVVDTMNPRRLLRALEVCYQTGQTFTSFRQRQSKPRPFTTIRFALSWEREALCSRIDQRVDKMMEEGLLEEARSLYPFRNLNALNTVGYKELFAYFDGRCSLKEAIQQIKTHTRQYAKRQMTWLRKDNSYIWVKPDALEDVLSRLV